jgi:DNA topoisomerase-1
MVDGVREKVSGYMIEGATLFKGRGKHVKAGLLKRRIDPCEITINVG